MSPKKRGGMRGRGRGMPKRRGRKPRQPPSPDTATADDSDADGTSTDGNVSITKHALPQSSSTKKKKQMDLHEERELSLPRLKPTAILENSTIRSMLIRDKSEDYIMTDDELDHLQWDLEAMLTFISVHKNTIRDELRTFASMQLTHSPHRTSSNPNLTTIKPRAAAEISPVNECRKMKVELDTTSKELPPSKTESANKFWSLVEPYLAHVKKEDLKWLEELVKSYSSGKELYEVPPLGEHYARNWAKEELELQKTQSSCSPHPAKRPKISERISPDVVELVHRASIAAHDGSIFTPVYHRVAMALIGHLHADVENQEHFIDCDDDDNKMQEMSNTCKEFYAEQNVKKQLQKLGLMGRYAKMVPPPLVDLPFPFVKHDEDEDEILTEIIQCKNSLAQLREMNHNHLTKLLEKCRIDYRQQIIKTKMEKVNDEILKFKRHQNESWTKEQLIAQMSEENKELCSLLEKRSKYLEQLQTVTFDPNSLSPSVSDDSETTDEESDPSSKLQIKTEPSVHNTEVKQEIKTDDECPIEENVEHIVQEEVVSEKMDCDEVNNDDKDKDNLCDDLPITNMEVLIEEIEKTGVNEQDDTEKADQVEKVQEDHNTLNIDVKTNDNFKQQSSEIEEVENGSCLVEPIIKRRRGKSKKDLSENEQATSNVNVNDSKNYMQIKQEPIEYDPELDASEISIDGIQQNVRPRKLNEKAYFDNYVGSTSESDFSDETE